MAEGFDFGDEEDEIESPPLQLQDIIDNAAIQINAPKKIGLKNLQGDPSKKPWEGLSKVERMKLVPFQSLQIYYEDKLKYDYIHEISGVPKARLYRDAISEYAKKLMKGLK
jgi:hypothetical protein